MFRYLHKIQKNMVHFMGYVELFVSLLVIAGILFRLTALPSHFAPVAGNVMSSYLQYLFDILIAVELIKLLCSHELASMVEIFMFAVSRKAIIEHLSVTENLISVVAITILFAVRKFLFIHQETYEEEKRRRTGYI